MRRFQTGLLAALYLSFGTLGSALADETVDDETPNPWGMAVLAGNSLSSSGGLRSPGPYEITDLGGYVAGLSGSAGTLTIDQLNFDHLFRRRFDFGVEGNYRWSDSIQSYARLTDESLGGRNVVIGSLVSAAVAAPSQVTASFSGMNNVGLEFGARYYWRTHTTIRPFAAVALGATHVAGVTALVSEPDLGLSREYVRFTRSGLVSTQSLETGVEYVPARSFGMRLGIEASRVGGAASSTSPALTDLGFNATRIADGRWAFPVTLAMTYHFD